MNCPGCPPPQKLPLGNGQEGMLCPVNIVDVFLDGVGALSRLDAVEVETVLFELLVHILHKFVAGQLLAGIGLSVDDDDFVFDLDGVSGDTHHPLDVVHGWSAGEFEDDDVSGFGVFHAKKVDGIPVDVERFQRQVGKGNFETIGKLVDQNEVPDHQGGDHGAGGNAEDFIKDGAEGEDQQKNDENGFAFFDNLLGGGQFWRCRGHGSGFSSMASY